MTLCYPCVTRENDKCDLDQTTPGPCTNCRTWSRNGKTSGCKPTRLTIAQWRERKRNDKNQPQPARGQQNHQNQQNYQNSQFQFGQNRPYDFRADGNLAMNPAVAQNMGVNPASLGFFPGQSMPYSTSYPMAPAFDPMNPMNPIMQMNPMMQMTQMDQMNPMNPMQMWQNQQMQQNDPGGPLMGMAAMPMSTQMQGDTGLQQYHQACGAGWNDAFGGEMYQDTEQFDDTESHATFSTNENTLATRRKRAAKAQKKAEGYARGQQEFARGQEEVKQAQQRIKELEAKFSRSRDDQKRHNTAAQRVLRDEISQLQRNMSSKEAGARGKVAKLETDLQKTLSKTAKLEQDLKINRTLKNTAQRERNDLRREWASEHLTNGVRANRGRSTPFHVASIS
ncbi:hypothetical protein LTR65_005637 [Meristemomyces frigidus]